MVNGSNYDLPDFGAFRHAAYHEKIKNSKIYDEGLQIYKDNLVDVDECNSLITNDEIKETAYYLKSYSLNLNLKILYKRVKMLKVTKESYLSSCFAYCISRFTGSEYVQLLMSDNGRDYLKLHNSFGLFTREFPILFNCQNRKIDKFIEKSNDILLNAKKVGFISSDDLYKKFQISTDICFQCLLEVPDDISKIYNRAKKTVNKTGLNKLNIYLYESNEKINIDMIYSSEYPEFLINNLLDTYNNICSEMLNKTMLSEIDYTPKKDLIFLDKNNGEITYSQHLDIMDVFENSVKRYPNNKCIVSGKDVLNYYQTNNIINYFANLLHDLGISEGDVIAYIVEPSV